MSIALVHKWSTYVNKGDPDFIIKNFIAEDSLLYYVPNEEICDYEPISLAISLIQGFADTIKLELIIKNVKWYEWQPGKPCHSSSSSSSSCHKHRRADTEARDGDVVISTVAFMSPDGMNPSLYNILFYLRAQCGCNYQVYRQVITPYNCLAKIAGNICTAQQ